MEWYHVYLFTRLDSVNSLFIVLSVAGVALSIVLAIVWAVNTDMKEYGESYRITAITTKKAMKISIPIASICVFMAIAIPTQKEAAAIYLLPKIANSDFTKEAQNLPTDAAKLLRLKLESWISDIELKKEEAGK